jgi:hypothetical protein
MTDETTLTADERDWIYHAEMRGEGGGLKYILAIIRRLDRELVAARRERDEWRQSCEKARDCARTIRETTETRVWHAALDAVAVSRKGCHDTYSGGHHYDGHYDAYHHGMDTVCTVLEEKIKALRARYPRPATLDDEIGRASCRERV